MTQAQLLADEAFQRIEGLLLHSIASPLEAPRLCAVQWARTLYRPSSPVACWICVLAAGDTKLEVREAGNKGLLPPAKSSAHGEHPRCCLQCPCNASVVEPSGLAR